MDETIEHLVQELMQSWNDHDVDRAAALYTPDYHGVDVADANPLRGPEGVRQSMSRYLDAFPDLHFIGIDIVTQDTRVAVHWMAHGTHRGALLNIPATGRKFSVSGTSFFAVGDGKLRQGTCVWDVAGLLRAIGLLPRLQ